MALFSASIFKIRGWFEGKRFGNLSECFDYENKIGLE